MRNKGLFKASLLSLPILVMLVQPVNAEENIHFSSCTEAWRNGYSDIHRGEPGYSYRLDKDGDGVACERSKAPRGVFKPRQSNSQARQTTSGWINKDGYWYYLKADGSYVKNSWNGNYYLKSDGKMAKNEWIYDGAYQGWYYFKSDGSYAKNSWQGNYYLKSDGKMAKNEWVDGGRYFVGVDGRWQKQKDDKPTTTQSTTTQSTTTEPNTSQPTTNKNNSDYTSALEKAKNYNSWANMSKKRLYKQLTSQYGEKFTSDAAQYAVDHLNADYKANALAKAKIYQKQFNQSKSAIYNQLISPYGEEFTEEEANYAIQHLDD